MSLAPWKVEFGAARQHMGIGDVVLARVQEVDECHNVVLTMKGVGLRRLNQGTVVSVPINHIDRLRGEGNATVQRLRDAADCRIIIGENGRVWIDGDAEGTAWARQAVALAQTSGHKTTFEAELTALEQNAPKKGDA
jgi:exosome complex component RRP4